MGNAKWINLYIHLILLFSVSCSSSNEQRIKEEKIIQSEVYNFKIQTLAMEGEIISDFDLQSHYLGYIIRERIFVSNLKNQEKAIYSITDQANKKFSHLLLHPKFDLNNQIFVMYVQNSPEKILGILRIELEKNDLKTVNEIFQLDLQSLPEDAFENISFLMDSSENLYINLNDLSLGKHAQSDQSPLGKVYKINMGEHPKTQIFTKGHRQITGLFHDKDNDRIYSLEQGPLGGDELNVLKQNNNYGWPEITYGINQDGSIISNLTIKEGMQQPLHYWTPSIKPAGILVYQKDAFPLWKDNIFVGSTLTKNLHRLSFQNNRYRGEEVLQLNLQPLKSLKLSNEGHIYLLESESKYLKRIIPYE